MNMMGDDMPSDSTPEEDESIPTIGEVYGEQLPEIKAADTKREAYEAIGPLVRIVSIYDLTPEHEDSDPGADGLIPEIIAKGTPLTEEEVEDVIVRATWEFIEKVSEEENSE